MWNLEEEPLGELFWFKREQAPAKDPVQEETLSSADVRRLPLATVYSAASDILNVPVLEWNQTRHPEGSLFNQSAPGRLRIGGAADGFVHHRDSSNMWKQKRVCGLSSGLIRPITQRNLKSQRPTEKHRTFLLPRHISVKLSQITPPRAPPLPARRRSQ